MCEDKYKVSAIVTYKYITIAMALLVLVVERIVRCIPTSVPWPKTIMFRYNGILFEIFPDGTGWSSVPGKLINRHMYSPCMLYLLTLYLLIFVYLLRADLFVFCFSALCSLPLLFIHYILYITIILLCISTTNVFYCLSLFVRGISLAGFIRKPYFWN